MITPPSALPRAGAPGWPGAQRRVGLEEGWTEEELVTSHYRPSDDSQPISVAREPLPREPPASLVDAFELELDEADDVEAPDAVDCTEVEATAGSFTVAEAPLPDWEPGAPVALAELVDTDAGSRTAAGFDEAAPAELELDDPPPPPVLDRTMLTPLPPELAAFASASAGAGATASPATAAAAASDDWLDEPVRTGKTMVVHIQDLIAAYAPPTVEPELDLPEDTAPATAPTTPRLSDELQAALDRLRRRDEADASAGRGSRKTEPGVSDEPAPRPSASGRRRRRPGATDVYPSPRRDDTQVRALYHAALATLGEPDRGDGK